MINMVSDFIRAHEMDNLPEAARIWVDLPENRSVEKIMEIYKLTLMDDGKLSKLTDEEIAEIAEKAIGEVA